MKDDHPPADPESTHGQAASQYDDNPHGTGRLALWPYGVDRERFHPGRRSSQARRWLAGGQTERTIAFYAGRLAPEKRLERLCPLARDPDIVLVLAGDGPQRPAMERQLAGCPARFTGWLSPDDLAAAYAAADVFVFPSTTETLGFSLIESLASGLPVVAADSSPTREILQAGHTGAILPVSEWDSGAPAAARWYGGPGRAAASHAARQRALRWDWTHATRQLTEIYRSLEKQDVDDRPGFATRRS